ncbi:hypothetical protein DFH08DRAFT_243694 [Mycena albidolilacea]|uniref:Uncharacterized protein n=1 Tax=Mycena albidolilacea TaxID=1033008 RepID=A0AAD6ZUU5_9AGAR|nr:hypothetical protein DFH08DRAFT_243694 [Mycena albidolilacea]
MDSKSHASEDFSPNSATNNAGSPSCGVFAGSEHFTVAGGTFTNTTKNYITALTAPAGFRMILLGDIDLQREIRLERYSGLVDRSHERARQSVRRVYSASIHGRKPKATVVIYQGENAEEEWRRDVARYWLFATQILFKFGQWPNLGMSTLQSFMMVASFSKDNTG